jgi:hypothetical protein
MFANLADDSTFTFGSDAFQTSYLGGERQNFALTGVPWVEI